MRFLYQYPDGPGSDFDMLDAGAVAEVARAVEAAGWDGLSFTEHPAPSARWLESGGHQTLDPFVALANAAAVTTRIRLVTYLSVIGYRNPLLLAKTAASVDKVSGGRFTLGIGAGYLKSEFRALGVDFDARNRLVEEALDVLPLHWSGEPFRYEGIGFEAREVVARPRPVQQPIPVWIGGNARATLRRVARRAQGWMPLVAPPEIARTTRTPHLASLDDLAARIRDVKEMAGDRAADLDFVVSYTDPTIARPDADPARHREGFARLAEMGATWIVLSGRTRTAADTMRFLDTFGANFLVP